MGTLKAKVNGIWTPVAGNPQSAADLARWNTAMGTIARTMKPLNEGGFGNAEYLISGFSGLNANPFAGRWTTIEWSLELSNRVEPSSPSYYTVRLRAGTGTGGAVLQSFIFPWRAGDQGFGGGYTAVQGISLPIAFVNANDKFTLTFNSGPNGMIFDIGPSSWVTVKDMGPVTQASVAPPAASPRVVASGNALGVIAVGTFPAPLAPLTVAAGVETVITNPLSFFAAVGRRYRINFQVRALAPTGAAGNTSFYLRDNGTGYRGWQPGGDPYAYVTSSYVAANFHWGMEGDNLQHSIDVACNGIGMSLFRDYGIFNVEDIGPNSSPALPIPETPQPWTPVSAFLNGWVNYGTGSTWPVAAYRKIGDEVQLRGLIRAGPIPASAFTLPVGFRPTGGIGGASSGYHFPIASNDAFGLVRVTADGDVRIGQGSNGWVDLASIRYSVTP